MTRKAPKEPIVTFTKPIVSTRLYVTQGPSGWNETFVRKKLDAELASFLGAATIEQAVDTFLLQRDLADDDKLTTWHTVLGFLGRTLDISPLAVPPEVGLAFWGHVELALKAQEAN